MTTTAASSSSSAAASAAQAWAILARHSRDEIRHLRLQELCSDDDRVSSLVAVHNANINKTNNKEHRQDENNEEEDAMLLVDLSRQRLTLDTINHLLRLANARNVPKYIQQLAWGQNDPDNPIIPLRLRTKLKQQQQQASLVSTTTSSSEQSTTRGRQATRFAVETTTATTGNKDEKDINKRTIMPTMHLALRVPNKPGLEMLTADGTNALVGIHRDWGRIERFSQSVRKGQLKGATGATIRDVIVVGRGVPVMALQFVYEALLRDSDGLKAATVGIIDSSSSSIRSRASLRGSIGSSTGATVNHRRMRFLSSLDPLAASSAVANLDPAATMVISIALKGTEETLAVTRTLKNWLLQGVGHSRRPDIVFTKHMLLVTGSDRVAAANKPEMVFMIPDHSRCEPFCTFTAATLLPLSIVFGWPIVNQLLEGAHDMDTHFVETNPRRNLPVLLALVDVWNDAFLGSTGRLVTPFAETFSAFPAYVAALESQTCGKMTDATSHFGAAASCSAMVMDGGLQGIYDRSLYIGSRVVPSELIMAMDTQVSVNTSIANLDGIDEVATNQDALICSCFAHADELAFGSEQPAPAAAQSATVPIPRTDSFGSASGARSIINTAASDGNRPSSLIICGKCNAFACGQLLALSEHRTVIKAKLYDMDPFAQEVGSSLRLKRMEDLKDELQSLYTRIATTGGLDDDDESNDERRKVNLSTATLLGHYATMMHDQRVYVVGRGS